MAVSSPQAGDLDAAAPATQRGYAVA
jgi:hypothetical protein